MSKNAIIVSATSEIGTALARRWLLRGWQVTGTFRSQSKTVDDLAEVGMVKVPCDVQDIQSVDSACDEIGQLGQEWDVLVICTGLLDPIGRFEDLDCDEWEQSYLVNFVRPVRIVSRLLSGRRRGGQSPLVIFFAGGGVNNAPTRYSAYTSAKVSLIKMCELLDAEVPDARFVILGTGWLKTKIHDSTLRAGRLAGDNLQRTVEKLAGNECTPMERVLDCCDWVVDAPRESISGRNFSVAHDNWECPSLSDALRNDSDMYKLRRSHNNWQFIESTEETCVETTH